jgi:MFS family permease
MSKCEMEKTVSEYGSRSASDAFTVASSQESLPEKTLSAYASRTASDASSQDSLLKECLDEHGLTTDHAGFVRWRNDNPRHPRNWTLQAKVYNTVIVLLLEFITSAVGTAGTAAAQDLQNDFKINLDLLIVCLTSSYLVGQCVGGIFFPPFSEVFGRKTLYIVSTIIYAVSSVIAASVHLLPVVVVARMMSGLASAIPTIVVAGSIEDVFNSRARVWWIFVWASVGTAAVAVGPIFGSYVTQSASLGWYAMLLTISMQDRADVVTPFRRWVFYMPAIGLGIVLGFCLTLKETRPSLLLCREAAVVKRRFPDQKIQILNPDEVPGFRALVTATLLRPLRLLFTEPIIAAVAFMGAVTTVLFYTQAESIPLVFQLYGWSPAAASLGFVPLLLGSLTSFLVRFVDQHKLDKIVRNNQRIEPEDKLTGFAIAAPFLAFGESLTSQTRHTRADDRKECGFSPGALHQPCTSTGSCL